MQIKSTADVTAFARFIIFEKKVNFHPDTPFDDYITPEKKQYFTNEECLELETTLEKCWLVCEEANADIYELMGDVLFEALGFSPSYP